MSLYRELEKRIERALVGLGYTPPYSGDTTSVAFTKIALALEDLILKGLERERKSGEGSKEISPSSES